MPHRPSTPIETADTEPLPSQGLLSSYDRLRRRIERYLERRGGRLGSAAAEGLLLVPDVFVLIARLALEPAVPASTRAVLASALAYLVVPSDLLPELVLGPGGYADDLVVGLAVLSQVFSPELEPLVERYWSGPGRVRDVLRDLTRASRALVGESLSRRLNALLRRLGVDIGDDPATSRQAPAG